MSGLCLKFATKTSQTLSDTDSVITFISPDGKKVLVFYSSQVNYVSDLPKVIYAIYPICDDEILVNVPLVQYTSAQAVADKKYILAVAPSPCFNQVLVVSAYQNYSDYTDTNNLFVTVDGLDYVNSSNCFRKDLLLELYEGCKLVSCGVIGQVYLAPLLIVVTWTLPEMIVLSYPFSIVPSDTDPTPCVLEVRCPSDLCKVKATSIIPYTCNRFYAFKLKECTYIAASGCASNMNPILQPNGMSVSYLTAVQIPSHVIVYKPEYGCIEVVTKRKVQSFSRWIDVKIKEDEACILNVCRLPVIVGCHSTFGELVPGLQYPLYPECKKHMTSVQEMVFNGCLLKHVRDVDTGLPSSFSSGYIPRSNSYLIASNHPTVSTSYCQLRVYSSHGSLISIDTPICQNSQMSFDRSGELLVVGGSWSPCPDGPSLKNLTLFRVEH